MSVSVLAVSLLAVSPAAAQTPLVEVIPTMLGPDMTVAPGPGGTHARDFARNFGEADLVSFPKPEGIGFAFGQNELVFVEPEAGQPVRGFAFNYDIMQQLATFPVGSSSGGFLYGFDPAVGTFVRSSRSFGASYGERPLTSGRGTLSVGFGVQNVEFDKLEGTSLDGPDMRFYYVHRDLAQRNAPALTPERSDVMEATLRLGIRTRTMLTTVTYGVTDRLDIGATIPLVRTTLEARVDKRILRLGTASDPTIHSFDGRGSDTATSTRGGTASGLGDLRIVAKYNLVRRERWALGGLWDVRLPTGDSSNLLGTGALFTRVLGTISTGSRNFSTHANIGATFASKNFATSNFVGEPGDEINYAVGFDWSAVPKATVSADFLVRQDPYEHGKMTPIQRNLPYVTRTGGPVQTQAVREFEITEFVGRQIMQAVIGGKVSAWRTMLLVANVLLPFSDDGLTNKPAISAGLEYTFGR
jgi:hypothetical protein